MRDTVEAIARTEDDLESKLKNQVPTVVVTTNPVVITGVQRKINIGNYETIDVYCAVSMPQNTNPQTLEELAEMVKSAAADGFTLTSTEVNDRYQTIKKALKDAKDQPTA